MPQEHELELRRVSLGESWTFFKDMMAVFTGPGENEGLTPSGVVQR